MQTRKIPLTAYRAMQCEQGVHEQCDCRCGGALHGARRFGLAWSPLHYYLLPADDPHCAAVPQRGYQLTFDDLAVIAAIDSVRVLAPDPGAVVPLSNPDLRPEAGASA